MAISYIIYFIRQILAAINDAIVISKRQVKYRNLINYSLSKRFLLRVLFVRTAFVVSIISLHVVIESVIILPKYLPFLQLRVAGFQIK